MDCQEQLLRGLRVLLVQEVPDPNRELAGQLLRAGAEVTLECDAWAAWDRLTRADEAERLCHVVLFHLVRSMPDIPAWVGASFPRSDGPPVLAVAENWSPRLSRRWLAAGCRCFFPRAASPALLTRTIAQAAGAARSRDLCFSTACVDDETSQGDGCPARTNCLFLDKRKK
jgi:hypothetical protein